MCLNECMSAHLARWIGYRKMYHNDTLSVKTDMSDNLARLPLKPHEVEDVVREVSLNSERVFLTQHARERMMLRSITLEQVLSVLRYGSVFEKPRMSKEGDWTYLLEHRLLNGLDAKVAVVLEEVDSVLVITVMWNG